MTSAGLGTRGAVELALTLRVRQPVFGVFDRPTICAGS